MATIEVSFADYVRGVRTSAQGAVVLAARLEAAAPPNMNVEERRMLRLVTQRAEEVAAVLAERDRLGPARLRPLLASYGNDWGALYGALSSKARVSSHVSSHGPEAAALSDSLFPDGVGFTQLESEAAWAEGQRRLERIRKEELGPKIAHLVGNEFLVGIQRSTDALASALGTAKKNKRAMPNGAALSESLVRFSKAVSAYCRVLAAHVDEDDDASVQRFALAVVPLDIHRASQRNGGSDTSTTDTTPTEDTTTPAPSTLTPVPPPPFTTTSSGSTPAPAPTSAPTSNGSTPSPAASGSDVQAA